VDKHETNENNGLRKARGRPRAFDVDRALQRALLVFWRRGYEGASLAELTRAMGINRPSLYAAFGNKEQLFLKVLDRYTEMRAPTMAKAMAAPTARETAAMLLYGVAECAGGNGTTPPGLFFVQTLLACAGAEEPLREELNARRMSMFVNLQQRFQRGKKEGDLPGDADPAELAGFVTAAMFGMSVMAVCGTTRKELGKIVESALRAWPGG
jgi:AcrR family transcriptional regulator